jgi:predicted DNA-binding protein (UPF0251 family)
MMWGELDRDTRELVEGVLTRRQLEAVRLLNAQPGIGTRTLARQLGVDRKTLRDRLDAAERKIVQAIEDRERSRGT